METSIANPSGQNPPEAPRYKYHSLPQHHTIRLLELHSGTVEQDVRASIFTRPGNPGTASYEALSYVWGQHEDTLPLKISTGVQDQYCLLPVTRNLYNALRYLRYTDKPRVLWVDAVCINQQDLQERGAQVAMMADIYGRAKTVLIWVGEHQDDSTHALQLLRDVGSNVHVDWLHLTWKWLPGCSGLSAGLDPTKEVPHARGFWALRRFFDRPWFERLWVRQEVRAASSATLICGHDTVPWSIFKNAMFVLRNRCRHLAIDGIAQHDIDAFVKRLKFVYRICSPQSYSLGVLRADLASLQCSDPRDRIYGMLSLFSRGERSIGITPRYDSTTAEVYQDVTLSHIRRFQSLLLLTQCELQASPAIQLPSWVPDWSVDQVTLPMFRSSCYAHAGFASTGAKYLGEGVLCVEGVRVEGVQLVWPLTFTSENVEESLRSLWKSFLALPRNDDAWNEQDAVEELASTLCIGHFRHTRVPEIMGQLDFKTATEVLKKMLLDQHDESSSTGDHTHDGGPMEAAEQKFEAKVIESCRHRALVVTDRGGLALAPEAAQPSDEIFVLLGCRTAMLLRKTEQDSHKIVGSAYSSQVNHGEALVGKLPAHIQKVVVYNSLSKAHLAAFQDTRTQKTTYQDPRINALREHVSINAEDSRPSRGLNSTMLIRAGIAVQEIRLV